MAQEITHSDDSMSSYYIHHSENPGLILVSQLLTGDNFASWYRAMIIALSVKNKLGFVDGSVLKPDNSDPSLLTSWKRNNNMGQTSVSVYFTKLKTIWEELNHFRPQCVCGSCCEGIRKLELHHQMDYVLAFFMGLNESFSQVRSQILLIDHLPSINKVFSMIIQEERQRQFGSQEDDWQGYKSGESICFRSSQGL
ncbi:uncharacterized protein [Primulina huaijiensis]|uniref:uncharacterized protein n=1 Tax=Primulina huaijiensis TaxID=1492673 RepID=UPI003CC785BB